VPFCGHHSYCGTISNATDGHDLSLEKFIQPQ